MSVYGRLLKRAWGQRSLNANISRYHNSQGFTNHERTVDVARALIADFVDKVRSDKAIPYVILFNDRFYENHLYQSLESVLNRKKIPYYSTHHSFPATELSNFIADGHFKPEIDIAIATEVHEEIIMKKKFLEQTIQ